MLKFQGPSIFYGVIFNNEFSKPVDCFACKQLTGFYEWKICLKLVNSVFVTHMSHFYTLLCLIVGGRISRGGGWVFRKNILKWGGGVIIK